MKPYREAFFPMALLSNFTFLVRFLRPEQERKPDGYEDEEVLVHHSQATKFVRRKLEDRNGEEAKSQGTVSAVLALRVFCCE